MFISRKNEAFFFQSTLKLQNKVTSLMRRSDQSSLRLRIPTKHSLIKAKILDGHPSPSSSYHHHHHHIIIIRIIMPNKACYKNLNLRLVTNPFKAQRPPSPHSNSTYSSFPPWNMIILFVSRFSCGGFPRLSGQGRTVSSVNEGRTTDCEEVDPTNPYIYIY